MEGEMQYNRPSLVFLGKVVGRLSTGGGDLRIKLAGRLFVFNYFAHIKMTRVMVLKRELAE